ncbi:PucR family transcriptional regulator [Crystallibacter degradans]|uniref:PucR family transcriptional regulator n=1 Tax=Crystallibacter degradans TaxID=2726743 RepID=UPI001472F5EA|nr:PucR family transcriptional regulator [Arthrobacter sp. SF27]NMR28118.1 PucR family transcriptional regulator [Arthrobacter sp. SF27]
MSITVAELLAEPQLGLSLLAGSDGLQQRITWAHTSDLPRLWEWVTGGEIMMTNGLSIPADAAGQVALAEALVAAGASALAIGEKMHAPELTPEFLEACDRLPLPVLNVPYPLPFISIARSVAESSLLEESRRLRQTARIYDLLRLAGPLDEQWQALVHGVAAQLDAELYVVDRRCLDPWHPGGEALPAGLAGQLEPLIAAAPASGKKFQWHHVDGSHVLMMDVPTHDNALLLVLPRSEPHPDAVVLLHAASVLGLELSRTMLALEDQRRLGAEFLAQALEGRYALADLESRLNNFQLPSEKFVIVSVSGLDEGVFATIHAELWRHGLAHVSLRQFNTLHIVLPPECSEDHLRHSLPHGARIGMSRPTGPAGMQRALQESLWALGTAGSTGQTLVRYGDGPSWLGLTSMEEGQAMVQRLLGPILEYERGRQPDLLKTLKTYLNQQRSWQKTAAALFTHRQTVIYRIRKISELTGLDMAETSSLAQLWFALQIHQTMDLQHHAMDRAGNGG